MARVIEKIRLDVPSSPALCRLRDHARDFHAGRVRAVA